MISSVPIPEIRPIVCFSESLFHYCCNEFLFLLSLAAEPSPLHTTTIVENTLKLVDDYKHMLCQATEPMSTFLEYIRLVKFFGKSSF